MKLHKRLRCLIFGHDKLERSWTTTPWGAGIGSSPSYFCLRCAKPLVQTCMYCGQQHYADHDTGKLTHECNQPLSPQPDSED